MTVNYDDIIKNVTLKELTSTFPKTKSWDDAVEKIIFGARSCDLILSPSSLLKDLTQKNDMWMYNAGKIPRIKRDAVSCLRSKGFSVKPCQDLDRFECVANRFAKEFGSLESREEAGELLNQPKQSNIKGTSVSHDEHAAGLMADTSNKPLWVEHFEKSGNTMENMGKFPKELLDVNGLEKLVVTAARSWYDVGVDLGKEHFVDPKLLWRYVRAFCKKGEMADCEDVDVWVNSENTNFPVVLGHPNGFSVAIVPANDDDVIPLKLGDVETFIEDPDAGEKWLAERRPPDRVEWYEDV